MRQSLVALIVLYALIGVPSGALGSELGNLETTLAVAGDVACDPDLAPDPLGCREAQTAALVSAAHPDWVIAAGDLQYDSGVLDDFQAGYDAAWGGFKSTTLPVPGNHEYNTFGAAGYYAYWGATAGSPSEGWYAKRVGSWLILALNSNCAEIAGCSAASPQGQWLQATLAASDAPCQLAVWHHPRFSSGAHGDNVDVQPLWDLLQTYRAEVVVAGHDHEYERFAPMLGDGTASQVGLHSFVIGTGGIGLRDFAAVRGGSEERVKKFGIGVIELHANGWVEEFRAIDGTVYPDGAEHECASAAGTSAVATATVGDAAVAAGPTGSVTKVRVVGSSARVALMIDQAGRVVVRGTNRGQTVCTGSAVAIAEGAMTVACRLNARGRRWRSRRTLRVALSVLLTPKGGAPLRVVPKQTSLLSVVFVRP